MLRGLLPVVLHSPFVGRLGLLRLSLVLLGLAEEAPSPLMLWALALVVHPALPACLPMMKLRMLEPSVTRAPNAIFRSSGVSP